ncbi:MAG: threonine--tRNA ligase [Nanoarchaeota archaeon]|nr:threonine--tRNA ligase [Nanoarchaeota archaeon]
MDFKFKDQDKFWHSSAHLMAQAVLQLWPKAKTTIGPTIETGFYYDFYKKEPFTPNDLKKIEEKMKELAKKDQKIIKKTLTIAEAKKLFKDNKFKIELIEELKKAGEKKVTAYQQSEFIDLCQGPHLKSTGQIKAFKLTKISSAYWRGDSNKPSLQRIYGISFPDKKQLKKYLHLLQEAEKRDHRKIGAKLDLFSFHEEAPGMPFYHDGGVYLFKTLVLFMREELRKRNYIEAKTPILMHKNLWLKSGHWDNFKENMYFTKIDEQENALKPMNCPGQILIYKEKLHSYKEFPIRMAEFGLVHRHELSGVLSGLFRVRVFTQDDAHVFCLPSQLKDEIKNLIDLAHFIYKTFGFDYEVELSTKPKKSIGTKEMWNKAEKILKETLKEKKLDYKLNPGEGAFYGPKIDFHLKDAIGRTHQCATIQVDFSMPDRYNLTYMDEKGSQDKRPVMLHRTIFGSMERFIGVLIEHYAGNFPLWLNPNQIIILPIADRHNKFAQQVKDEFFKAGFRVVLDTKVESTSKKIREAQLNKFNYILVIGDTEVKNKTVNVRTRDNKVHGEKKVDDLIKKLKTEVEDKK